VDNLKLLTGFLEKFRPKRALTACHHPEVLATQVEAVRNPIRRAVKLIQNSGDVTGSEIHRHGNPFGLQKRDISIIQYTFIQYDQVFGSFFGMAVFGYNPLISWIFLEV
jgi:hypothetical protein